LLIASIKFLAIEGDLPFVGRGHHRSDDRVAGEHGNPARIDRQSTTSTGGCGRDTRRSEWSALTRHVDLDRLADLVGDIIRTDNMTVRQR
jgi:hypothetical protein